ncbi:hypothetical protein TNCV_3234211 [Trichonephila clavipes]|nr:hypothetical protein TNCV_3234211 [Trichonephila clavipes]
MVRAQTHSLHGTPEIRQTACRTANSLTGCDILPWPADSPDLNPIEHLWDLITRDINRRPLAQTVNNLRTEVDVTWQRLLQATINELVDRMPRRVKPPV